MQAGVGLLDTDVMPIFMIIALDIVITLHFSINCSAVICSSTVLFYIMGEASSETYGPRVYFPSYKCPIYNFSFRFTFFAIFYFPFHKPKIPKILLYRLSIYIRSHFANNCEGTDNPLSRWVQVGVCLCRYSVACRIVSYWIDTLVLKTEGNTYSTLLHHPFLFKGKPMQAQEVAGRISGAVPGEIYIKPRHTKYPS